jgi:hypothetical protein
MEALLKALVKKKADKDMDPTYKDAKMGILKQISDLAAGHMGNDIKGLKQVTVAAPDDEGVKAGLDVAKDVVGSPDLEQAAQVASDDDDDGDEMSEDEIDALIAALQAKKAKC